MSHWQAKTKIRSTDRKFSEYIRRRDQTCVYKVRCFGQSVEWKYDLDCSHFHSRRHEGTRVDPLNADAACRKCHDWVGRTVEGMRWLKEFKLKQLGEREYNLLEIRAATYHKRDDRMDMFYIKQLLDSLE